MPARLHALVQDADDLDQVGGERTIIENMRRPSHPRIRIVAAGVSQMKAADARESSERSRVAGPFGSAAALRVAAARIAA
jgi:hypothetical protein